MQTKNESANAYFHAHSISIPRPIQTIFFKTTICVPLLTVVSITHFMNFHHHFSYREMMVFKAASNAFQCAKPICAISRQEIKLHKIFNLISSHLQIYPPALPFPLSETQKRPLKFCAIWQDVNQDIKWASSEDSPLNIGVSPHFPVNTCANFCAFLPAYANQEICPLQNNIFYHMIAKTAIHGFAGTNNTLELTYFFFGTTFSCGSI